MIVLTLGKHLSSLALLTDAVEERIVRADLHVTDI